MDADVPSVGCNRRRQGCCLAPWHGANRRILRRGITESRKVKMILIKKLSHQKSQHLNPDGDLKQYLHL
jgi:hypothetical protein